MNAYTTVLLYAGWILLLALFYATPRIPQALLGQKRIDSWERGKEPIDPMFLQRAKSAHLNCLENFPVFAAVVAVAGLMGQIETISAIAVYVLYARIAVRVLADQIGRAVGNKVQSARNMFAKNLLHAFHFWIQL